MLTSWPSSHVVGWLLAATTMTTTAAAKASRAQKVLTNITGFLFYLCLQVPSKISASLTLSFFSIAQPETTFRQKLSVEKNLYRRVTSSQKISIRRKLKKIWVLTIWLQQRCTKCGGMRLSSSLKVKAKDRLSLLKVQVQLSLTPWLPKAQW